MSSQFGFSHLKKGLQKKMSSLDESKCASESSSINRNTKGNASLIGRSSAFDRFRKAQTAVTAVSKFRKGTNFVENTEKRFRNWAMKSVKDLKSYQSWKDDSNPDDPTRFPIKVRSALWILI